jgi:hypothetical protein
MTQMEGYDLIERVDPAEAPGCKEVGLSGVPPDITNTFILRNDLFILTREMGWI